MGLFDRLRKRRSVDAEDSYDSHIDDFAFDDDDSYQTYAQETLETTSLREREYDQAGKDMVIAIDAINRGVNELSREKKRYAEMGWARKLVYGAERRIRGKDPVRNFRKELKGLKNGIRSFEKALEGIIESREQEYRIVSALQGRVTQVENARQSAYQSLQEIIEKYSATNEELEKAKSLNIEDLPMEHRHDFLSNKSRLIEEETQGRRKRARFEEQYQELGDRIMNLHKRIFTHQSRADGLTPVVRAGKDLYRQAKARYEEMQSSVPQILQDNERLKIIKQVSDALTDLEILSREAILSEAMVHQDFVRHSGKRLQRQITSPKDLQGLHNGRMETNQLYLEDKRARRKASEEQYQLLAKHAENMERLKLTGGRGEEEESDQPKELEAPKEKNMEYFQELAKQGSKEE